MRVEVLSLGLLLLAITAAAEKKYYRRLKHLPSLPLENEPVLGSPVEHKEVSHKRKWYEPAPENEVRYHKYNVDDEYHYRPYRRQYKPKPKIDLSIKHKSARDGLKHFCMKKTVGKYYDPWNPYCGYIECLDENTPKRNCCQKEGTVTDIFGYHVKPRAWEEIYGVLCNNQDDPCSEALDHRHVCDAAHKVDDDQYA